jgi:membrane protease YdiL (CAAX protease family)
VGQQQQHHWLWTAVTALEVTAASVAVVLDLVTPTFVLLALACLSLLIRRTGWASLGLHHSRHRHLAPRMLAFAAAWSVLQLSVTITPRQPYLRQAADLSQFKDLQGNLGLLIGLIALSWTVAAIGEELAYRGYLQTRMRELFGSGAGLRPVFGITGLGFRTHPHRASTPRLRLASPTLTSCHSGWMSVGAVHVEAKMFSIQP